MSTFNAATAEPTGLEIAIVGMAGRFPGADDVDAFWRNIRDGVESVSTFTDDQLRERGVPQALLDEPDYVKAGVLFEGFDQFDAGFFGYTPREAENLDPQQRVFLECASAALEHAGCDPERWLGKVGVYAGEGTNVYLIRHLLPSFGLGAHTGIADLLGLMSGNAGGSLCTRVAYKLNLRGPAVTVQTACSTSLTAVHTACQALLSHDCDMALAGGVWLNLLQEGGYRYQAGAILSRDGHCRAFDADADGTVIGSGVGVVTLKRLDDALRDGDTIHAVIKGTAANNDGAAKVGFTAPSIDGQADVIRAAQLIAGVSADTIGYVEAHGTGTTLGDPIEIAALTQAFRVDTDRRGFCAVGSVKTNIGHLDAAAGVAGLIKAAMALKHHTLPPSLHFTKPNPQIDFAGSPFYVNAQCQPWPEGSTPRRAGVSSFGIGGTNVHVVLEEAPVSKAAKPVPAGQWQVLPLSARDEAALAQGRKQLAAHLRSHDTPALDNVAHTLQEGRRVFDWRSAVVANQSSLAAEMLSSPAVVALHARAAAPEVAFLFPGGGTQHARMGEGLYRDSAVYREALDRCAALLEADGGIDLLALLFPGAGDEQAANARLSRIEFAQPALFAVEYAMAHWWMACGVRPALLLGHSLGEYVAACLAGVFSLEDALHIVAARGRLMQTLAPGAMTAVSLSEAELAPFIAADCDLAAVNGEALCVLAGTADAIARAEEALLAAQHQPRRLHVAIASHSRLVEPMMAELERLIASVPKHAPRIPLISNVTGRPITAEEATSPAYWGRHLRGTVRFADGLREVFAVPGRVVLEVGPGETLAGLARQHPGSASAAGIWASQAHPQQLARNAQQLANAVGGLWTVGVEIDWAACRGAPAPQRVPLPTYAFQRRRFWAEPGEATLAEARATPGLFYAPLWKRTALPLGPVKAVPTGCTLVLGDADSFTDRLARTLRAEGARVVLALRGKKFSRTAKGQYAMRPAERADHEALLREVEAEFGPVTRLFHLWSLDGDRPAPSQAATFEAGYFSLLALSQALDEVGGPARAPLALTVVTDRVEDIAGTEALAPEKATVLGIAKVLGQESSAVACRVVDVVLPAAESAAESDLAYRVVQEAAAAHYDFVVAYRGPHRWTRSYDALPARTPDVRRLREGGVYLITGGLGGVGLALARYLSRTWRAKLVLLGRTPLPERSAWARLAASADQPASLRRRLQQLTALEAEGAQIMTVSADVTDPAQLRSALAAAHERFGVLNGVVHAVVQPDRGMIAQRTQALVEAAFAPKIAGTLALLDVLRAEPLDFVLLCSSVASLIGGLGRSDYAAANAYLDALAHAHRRSAALPVFSVNWDAWRDVGVAVDMDMPEGVGLDERTGVLAFERIVNGPDLPQTVVSITPFAPRLRPLDDLLDALGDDAPAEARAGHPRPVLQTAFRAPEGDLEEGLAELWTEALGIAPIGANDNLFELGGDSLLAIRLLSRVRKAYGVELHPAVFFKAPTIAELAALIDRCLKEEIEGDPETALVPARPARDAIARSVDDGSFAPVSFAQQGQWFLWQLDPGNTAYHVGGGLGFAGSLDVAALQDAMHVLAMRHDTLRTVFRAGPGGMPEQRIESTSSLQIPFVDLSTLSDAQRASRYAEIVQEVCRRPFDLTAGAPWRATLLKMAEGDHQLLLTLHHIGADAWSVELILDELAGLYANRVNGAPVRAMPDPDIRYVDFSQWQRRWLESTEGERQLAHWRRRLGGTQPVLELPTDRPRSVDSTYSASQHTLDIPVPLARELKRQASAQGGTLFMVLLAAFHALLHRYTGQDDIRIGVPVAGRNRPETAGVVGMFINTVVMDARMHPRMRLSELLAQMRDTSLDAQAHQELPFECLVQALRPDRGHAGTTMFQVMFNHLGEGDRPLRGWPGLQVRRIDLEERAAPFELTLETIERADGGIRAAFRYAAELFEPGTIERLAGHYRRVLEALVAQPTLALRDLDLLDDAERSQLVRWGGNARHHGESVPVHRLIERQASTRPDAVALVFDGQTLSYRELNRRANQVAHRLIAQGVRPETSVGVALERSVELVVALLGVMKAGGAYVPLDPQYPVDRLAYMVEDSGLTLVLTQAGLRECLSWPAGIAVLALDAMDFAGCAETDPVVPLHAENLAYVIYTSGSTGKPKGAANRHGALHNRLAWMQEAYGLGVEDTVLQKTPFSFDVSVWEFFWPLTQGARLIVARPDDHREPARLVELIRRHGVSTLHFVPSMLQAFLAHEGVEACTSLRRIVCSGEALPAEARNGVHARLPGAALYNLYGPTEAAIDVTHWTCRNDGRSQVAIGQPISGMRTHVLDASLNLVPPGVAGELYLGGVGLARGYVKRAELTAERFVADPFDPHGGRLYRTGDLVRWNSQGQLDYLGRLDHQVKIRGFRIELGEIEAQLLAQPEVREAVVVARQRGDVPILVAYLSMQAGHAIDAAQLRARLGRTLPAYMVPGVVVTLEALPLNTNGKVDRRALPDPGQDGGRAHEAPQDDTEVALAAIWAEVLGVERIGRNDHFFELGGHSLMSMQVVARVQGSLHAELAVKDVFQHPVLRDMAALIVEAHARKPLAQSLRDIDALIDAMEEKN